MKIFALALAIFAFSFCGIAAQEIQADVTVNMDQLTDDARVNVTTFESDMEKYINSQKFTDVEWEGEPIPVDISVFLSGGSGGRYNAKIFLASKRYIYGQEGGSSVVLRMIDDKWTFEYARGASLSYNPYRFDELTSLIDYYMTIIIGFDLDTYGQLDGSQVFNKAKDIVMRGASVQGLGYEMQSQPGAMTRYNFVSELTDMRYEDVRKAFFVYYVDGLDLMAEDKAKAMDNVEEFIRYLYDYKQNKMIGSSVLMQVFFDSKHDELAAFFDGDPREEEMMKLLMYIDSSHATKYQNALDKK